MKMRRVKPKIKIVEVTNAEGQKLYAVKVSVPFLVPILSKWLGRHLGWTEHGTFDYWATLDKDGLFSITYSPPYTPSKALVKKIASAVPNEMSCEYGGAPSAV
jgi:hypothetical protein